MYRKLSLLFLLLLPNLVMAEFRAFTNGSLKEITAAREGRPFLLVLWSVDCPPCLKELEEIGQLYPRFPAGGLVFISTDGADYADEAEKVLHQYGLAEAENWRFADGFPERMRYQIDPNWYGELPRTYIYNSLHHRIGRSGILSQKLLQQFITMSNHIE
ncbi:MAG: redoxin domain-containing protein [Candidatus Polarisedimenticolaceae bacterium]|nr:redoxin domain-containing protein [Candidatus Polarisedimenticolaceae bacterium]